MKKYPLAASCALFAILVMVGGAIQTQEDGLFWPGYLAMAFFYGAMFYLGLSAARKKKDDLEQTLLAGRSLPLGVALLPTMTATWVGGGFINGTAESVASSGLVWTQAPWGYALSLIFGGLLFARPMRRRNFTTMLDPLEDRFGQRMAGVLYIPALLGEVFWTGAILTALGTTFGFILGINFNLSIVFSSLIAIIYTSVGGLWAVAKTDVLQLGILIFGLFLAMFFVVPDGDLSQLYAQYQDQMGDAARLWPPTTWGHQYFRWCDYGLLLVFGGIPWHVYFQRVLSSKDEQTAQWLSIGAGGLCLVAAFPAVVCGMVCATTNWQSLGETGPAHAAIALPYVLKHLTPPLVATLGLGALAAAVMSSVDSSILSASSMGAWNVYRPLAGSQGNHDSLQRVVKRLIWIIGIAATLVALRIQSVYALWFLCSDLVYCILFPQLFAALFDRKANTVGSLAGVVVSTALRLGGGEPVLGLTAWISYPMQDADGVVNFPFRTTSMLGGLVTVVLVSRLTQTFCPPKPLITREL